MRRIILTVLLTAGIVAGVGSALRHGRCGYQHHYHHHHPQWDHDHHEGGGGADRPPAPPKSETK